MIISLNAGIYVFHVTNPTLRVIGIVIMVLATFQTHKAKLPLNTSTLKIPLLHYSKYVTANCVGPSKNHPFVIKQKCNQNPQFANRSVFDRNWRKCNQRSQFVRKIPLT